MGECFDGCESESANMGLANVSRQAKAVGSGMFIEQIVALSSYLCLVSRNYRSRKTIVVGSGWLSGQFSRPSMNQNLNNGCLNFLLKCKRLFRTFSTRYLIFSLPVSDQFTLQGFRSKMFSVSHKTVFVMDHCPYMAESSRQQVECDVVTKSRAQGLIPLAPVSKSLWTCAVECSMEYCRILYDIYPRDKLVSLKRRRKKKTGKESVFLILSVILLFHRLITL